MDNQHTASILNDLIQTCKDGELGFRACAEHASAGELKSLFSARAQDCADAAQELQPRVNALGVPAETSGSLSGALHRRWIDLKGAITGQDDVAILNECERGEDVALRAYHSALAKDLPHDLRSVIERQLNGVQRNHDQIKATRNRYRALDSMGSNPSAIPPAPERSSTNSELF